MNNAIPSVSVTYARSGSSTRSNELGMRTMHERAWEKRGEQYHLIKSPPASGKNRALMFIALDKLHNQDLRQTVVVLPELTIGASFEVRVCQKSHPTWPSFWVDPHQGAEYQLDR